MRLDDHSDAVVAAMVVVDAGGAGDDVEGRTRGHSSEEDRHRLPRREKQCDSPSLLLPLLPRLLSPNLPFSDATSTQRALLLEALNDSGHRVFQWRIDSVTEMTRSRALRTVLYLLASDSILTT